MQTCRRGFGASRFLFCNMGAYAKQSMVKTQLGKGAGEGKRGKGREGFQFASRGCNMGSLPARLPRS